MIEAILSAVPSLLPVMALLSVCLTSLAVRQARRRDLPVRMVVLWSLSLAAELTATLTPTDNGGASSRPSCAIGSGMWATALTEQGLMNIALYVPLAFFSVLVFRRPLLSLASCVVLSAGTELTQTLLGLGRACDGADFIDNTLGALIGVLPAIGLLWVRRRESVFTRRDMVQSTAVLSVGLAVAAAVLLSFVPVHNDAPGFVTTHVGEAEQAHQTAVRLFGPQTRVLTTSTNQPTPGGQSARLLLSVSTDQGTFQLEWPTGRLVAMASADNSVGQGTLASDELLSIGTRFAAEWFGDQTSGATHTLTAVGPGSRAQELSYRRYNADGVLMPMRLDITIAPSGRIMAATARRATDPQLPHPTVTVDTAKRQAASFQPGSQAGEAFLLAKQITGQWRPCWAVNLTKPGGSKPANAITFVDAVSGQVVGHQG